jgi:glycosyltransferase involved in cell wall biosynthesis
MQIQYPFVSVIIPCRNEQSFIEATLRNIVEQDYPKDKLEVYVVDGNSTDKTKNIALSVASKHNYIRILDNPDKIVPHALNIGIKKSKGEVIVRMDAHSEYPPDYISVLVKNLFDLNADNTGGVWLTQPGAKTYVARAIAAASSHPFGIGNAIYRIGTSAVKQVDTVPFGCYRRNVFEKIGFFDIELIRNQDDEFNGRLIKNGGKIFLIPSVKIKYYARSTWSKLSRMFYQYGLFKPLVNMKLGYPATVRQLAPPLFVCSLILLLFLSSFISLAGQLFILIASFYILANIAFSIQLSFTSRILLFPFFLVTFPIIHFSYGFGYIHGIMRFVILRKHKREHNEEIDINR